MEEILASIRRIISEDDEEGGEKEAAAEEVATEPAPEPEPEAEEEDVMDLTEMVVEKKCHIWMLYTMFNCPRFKHTSESSTSRSTSSKSQKCHT